MEKEVQERLLKWKNDPICFMVEALGIPQQNIWPKVEELSYTVRDNRRTAVKAGHGVSKTWTMARIALWYLYCHYPSTVITTAPTHTQVEQLLWREIRDAKNNAKFDLGGKLTTTKLDIEDRWFAFGFSTKPDAGQEGATRMQGFHNEYVLVIFDEACGVIKPIWEATNTGLITGDNCKLVVIGNPTSTLSEFHDCFAEGSPYATITIPVHATPNYVNNDESIPGLSGRQYVSDVVAKYGEESNQYKVRVLGEFPDSDANGLLTAEWIKEAEEAGLIEGVFPYEKRFITWDVADGGADLHVIKAWHNLTELETVVLHNKRIEEAEPYVWKLLRKHRGNTIVYDADGMGRVAGGLLELSADDYTEILPFQGSSTDVDDPTVFKRVRDEGHWLMRDAFSEGWIAIQPCPDQREELLSLRLDENSSDGFLIMEKKRELKKRLGRSPNYSDAIMMACAMIEEVKALIKYEDDDPYGWNQGGQKDKSTRSYMAM